MSPQRDGVYLRLRMEYWNVEDPPMEEWNNGTLGIKMRDMKKYTLNRHVRYRNQKGAISNELGIERFVLRLQLVDR